MKELITILILMSKITFVFSQLPNDISKTKNNLPDKIKTVEQYQDDFLLNVWTYDTLKNVIFNHYKQYVHENWNGKYLTMITGNIYNNFGRKTKSYSLHSNAGFSIYYYEYDGLGNNTKTYERNNDFEYNNQLANKNPYHYVSDIKNIDELINHSKIKEIELRAKKYLLWERTFDSVGNLMTQTFFKKNGDTSGYKRNEYDKYNNIIYFYNESSKENHWEYYYEYENKISFLQEDIQTESQKSNLLQSVRVDYDWRENRKRISDITFFKYDDKGRLIEETKYNKGEFQTKYIYEYNEFGQVTKRVSYVYNLDKIAVERSYLHNQEGNVIEERKKDFRNGEENVIKYRYVYEYYE